MRKIIYMFLLLSIASCYSVQNINTNTQRIFEKNSLQSNKEEKNSNFSKINTNTDETLLKGDDQIFAKTFFIKRRWDDSQNKIIHYPYLVEFKDNNLKGIGIYIDGKEKAFLKTENNMPTLRANFLETDGKHYFILVISASATGTCGDAIFSIAEINDHLNVKMSKPNQAECQGELYPIKIENIDESDRNYRRISIGKLKFNADSFEWIENK